MHKLAWPHFSLWPGLFLVYNAYHAALLHRQKLALSFSFSLYTILCYLYHIDSLLLFPDMSPRYARWPFLVLFAFGTAAQAFALSTYFSITLVFSIPFSIGRGVFENLSCWAYHAAVAFVIYIVAFFKKAFLCHRSFIDYQYDSLIIRNLFGDPWGLIGWIYYERSYFGKSLFELSVKQIEYHTIMYILCGYFYAYYKIARRS